MLHYYIFQGCYKVKFVILYIHVVDVTELDCFATFDDICWFFIINVTFLCFRALLLFVNINSLYTFTEVLHTHTQTHTCYLTDFGFVFQFLQLGYSNWEKNWVDQKYAWSPRVSMIGCMAQGSISENGATQAGNVREGHKAIWAL